MTPIPRHVSQHLATTTGLPEQHLSGTRVVPRHCPDCGRLVLLGYDSNVAAFLATVDPYKATPHDEAAAVILARPTYRLWGRPLHYELTRRHVPGHQHTLTYPRADTPDVTVVLAHHCHTPPLAREPIPVRPPRPAVDHDAPPPF